MPGRPGPPCYPGSCRIMVCFWPIPRGSPRNDHS
uniref:Uncharacterized protein n=1 Tax=Arundo donax TaxID=35708 RepID=A0A0A9ECQ6_ARUDO